jgi:DNA-directed RNA polymerase subunit H (RpoH/RPB5)
MGINEKDHAYEVAKKMLVDGESWNKIMEETKLRLKDLKRIQKEEITPHF